MQARRQTSAIEWGSHEGKLGFIMRFTDDTSEAFLFDEATTAEFLSAGRALLEHVQHGRTTSAPPGSGVALGEAVKMRLV